MNLNFSKPHNLSFEDYGKLHYVLQLLSDQQKVVLHLRFWENLSINQISRTIGHSWIETDRLVDHAVNHVRIRFKQLTQCEESIEKKPITTAA